LSLAAAVTFTIPLTCALLAGALIDTVGGVDRTTRRGKRGRHVGLDLGGAEARLHTRVSSMRPLNANPEVPRRPMFTLLAEFCGTL
jgi:hypothetical protein